MKKKLKLRKDCKEVVKRQLKVVTFEIGAKQEQQNVLKCLLTCLTTASNCSSTSGRRSRRQAPMKTPPPKQEEKEMTSFHLGGDGDGKLTLASWRREKGRGKRRGH